MLFLMTMLTSLFCCSFCLFYTKKTYLSVCGKTTIHSTAMGDVLIERKFNYLLYDISHMQIGLSEHQRQMLT